MRVCVYTFIPMYPFIHSYICISMCINNHISQSTIVRLPRYNKLHIHVYIDTLIQMYIHVYIYVYTAHSSMYGQCLAYEVPEKVWGGYD